MRVVLICSNPVLGRLLIPSLRRMGARCHLICERGAEHLRLSRCCDGILLSSNAFTSESPERVIDAINHLARSKGIDCVLASDVDALLLLSRVTSRLECPTYPMSSGDLLSRLNNKWQFHNICRASGVDAPKTLYYPSKHLIDPAQVAASVGFPAVVKPIEQWSGTGVTVVGSQERLIDRVVRNDDYRYREVVVQEYVEGKDACFGGLTLDGKVKCWTTFLLHEEGMMAEFTSLPRLLHAAERIIAELRFTGIINFDVRIDAASGAIKFLECNPRFFMRARAARLCGLDFVRAGLIPESAGGSRSRSLTDGRHLPLGGLLSWNGWRQIMAGNWPASTALGTFLETASDPLPAIAELVRPRTSNRLGSPAPQITAPR